MFTEDPGIFLADFGLPVVASAATGAGILDLNSEIILGGEAVMIDFLLTVPTATFGSLGYGDTLTVDGTAYKVESQPLRFDDGTFCRVPLMLLQGAITAALLLLEDGFTLLAESGDRLALES